MYGKRIALIFNIKSIKLQESWSHFLIHSWPLFLVSNATNSFKCLCVFHFFQSSVPYMQISDMIPGVNIIRGKVSIASVKGAGGI